MKRYEYFSIFVTVQTQKFFALLFIKIKIPTTGSIISNLVSNFSSMDNAPGKTAKFKLGMKAKAIKPPVVAKRNVLSASFKNGIINDIVIPTTPASSTTFHQASISTHNTFDMLSDDDDTVVEQPIQHQEHVNTTRTVKCAPIVIVNSNVSAVQNLCNDVIKSKKFEISIMSIGIKVKASVKDELDLLEQSLKEKGMQSFKYFTSQNKPKRIALLGLHKMDLDELKECLKDNNVHPDSIELIQLKRKKFLNEPQFMYKLLFRTHHVNLRDLKEINHINFIKVKWEYFRTNADTISQCINCLMPGHSSVNCNMPPRCVLCAANHGSNSCPKKIPRAQLRLREMAPSSEAPVDYSFVKCANCSGQHTANYRGCPKLKEYKQILANSRPTRSRNSPKNNSFQRNSADFPRLNSQRSETNFNYITNNGPSWSDQLNSHGQKRTQLFSRSELLAFASDLISKLGPCQTAEEQALAVVDVVSNYLYGGNK